MAKKHGIRGHKKFEKLLVRVDCDNCMKWHCIACYEDEIEKREFLMDFYECENCSRIVCGVCADEDEKIKSCPFCDGKKLKKASPFDIYFCNVCINEWLDDGGLCAECKHNLKDSRGRYRFRKVSYPEASAPR